MIVQARSHEKRRNPKVSVDGTNGSGSLGESRRGEGGEEFLVKGCLACRVELIKDVNYEKVCGIYSKKERGRNILFLGCVYMPTDSENVSVIERS